MNQSDVDQSDTFQASVRLCDGRHPLVREASLRLTSTEAVLVGGGFEHSYRLGTLAVSPRIGSAPRFVALPDGGELECADAAWLDSLAQQEASEGPVAWLERRWWAALTAVGVVALSLALVYSFGLDALSDKLVQAIPIARERAFGEQSLRSLDQAVLSPSKLSEERTEDIRQGFAGFCAGIPEGPSLQLEFRDGRLEGANAFTLPGGIIVVTDQLVELMPSNEVLAVLAHELGHTHYRHVLRQGVKSSGSAIIAGAVMGDASSVAAGTGTALVLLGTQFSREFEREADAYAADLLRKNALSPALFADALVALEDELKRKGIEPGYSFLSTHPGSAERIAQARAGALAPP